MMELGSILMKSDQMKKYESNLKRDDFCCLWVVIELRTEKEKVGNLVSRLVFSMNDKQSRVDLVYLLCINRVVRDDLVILV